MHLFILLSFAWVYIFFRRRQWHPTPVLLPGKSMDRGAWWAAVHGVAKSRTRLSDFTFTFHFHALEKEMATHSSIFAWRIPGTVEPGGLLSMGSHRVGHDWSDLTVAAYILFHWSGTPVRSQLVFCMHFCVWRCIPEVSVERDVLQVHLLLHHLVLSELPHFFFS